MYNFSGLFNSKNNEEEESSVETPEFSGRWKWFSIIERLSNSDITKFEEVYKQTYISCLNLLSYWKEKEDYQERIRRRNEMMSKHR